MDDQPIRDVSILEVSILDAIRQDYDRVADEYTRHIYSELQHKPLDRELLTHLARRLEGKGEICDIGCGPGHVARFLRDAGANVFGLDLSAGMLEQARRLNPDITFRQGNMLALDLADASLAGIVAFYAVVNLPRASLPQAFREMARVLQPDGILLLAHHIGEETLHREEWWERPISLDFHLLQPLEVQRDLEAAGLIVEEIIERAPYAPEVEHQSRRAYIFARKPALAGSI
jgi:ubiquinone/menaquinone biosynthesis C-methylase UbiE